MRNSVSSFLTSCLLILGLVVSSTSTSHSVEFGRDATGDPNAIHIQGNTSGFLYSERIILTAAHVLKQLRIQPNGDTYGFAYAPGLADKSNAKQYQIIKAFIPRTFIDANPSKSIQPIDDFAIVVLNEDMPLKTRVVIATEQQMKRFAQDKAEIKMVGYGLQSGSQRNNPQEVMRAPNILTGSLFSPEMMRDHYNQYQGRPGFWNVIEWGVNSIQNKGTPCSGDSGAGFFVEENAVRYYVGTAGNGSGGSNCKADGTYSLSPGGAVSWFPAPNKFLDLIKTAETFVEEQKKLELLTAEEERIKAELTAKQDADAKATADLQAKQEADMTAAALKKKTISCVKGKLVKKVKAVKPVCPKGYRKK
jgi:hypothetical protein